MRRLWLILIAILIAIAMLFYTRIPVEEEHQETSQTQISP